ncbi:MAG: WcbI family polysaccharide biosynthesis putative acetyltransferase [Gammaproteobacteria bacterium]
MEYRNAAAAGNLRRAVVIVGMHRSGTSALARVVNILGAAAAQNLMLPQPDNPLGFWEPEPLSRFNEKILLAAERSWDDPRPMPKVWFNRAKFTDEIGAAAAILNKEFPGFEDFSLKDPRLARVLPLWLSVFEHLKIQPVFFLACRNPAEVAASLYARNGIGKESAQWLWLSYMLDAERLTRNHYRAIVHYDQLMNDWRKSLSEAYRLAGLDFLMVENDLASQIDAFLSDKHRHYSVSTEHFLHDPKFGALIKAVYTAFRANAIVRADDHERFDFLYAQLQDIWSSAIPDQEFLASRWFRQLEAEKNNSPRLGKEAKNDVTGFADSKIHESENKSMNDKKISVAMIVYNDFDFIADCIEKVYNFADEIIIVDGPYEYCTPIMKKFGLYYDGIPDALAEIVKLEKVKYFHKAFGNEKEKRVFLYNQCSYDIVMLLDADEIITSIDQDQIDSFINSDKSVASFTFLNMIRVNCIFGEPTKKYIVFKKNNISAEEHLDYTWLIGVNQNPPDRNKMFDVPLGRICHLTLMRSKYGSIVKYCFYTRLYYYTRGLFNDIDKLFGYKLNSEAIAAIDPEDLKEIFVHSMPWGINFNKNEVINKYDIDGFDFSKYQGHHLHGYLDDQKKVPIFNNVDSYHYISLKHIPKGRKFTILMTTSNIQKGTVEFIQNNFKTNLLQSGELQIDDAGKAQVTFEMLEDNDNIFENVIKIKATTKNEAAIGYVSDVRINKKFTIYGNCQLENIKDFLLSSIEFSGLYEYVPPPGRLVHMMKDEDVDQFYELLEDIDLIIVQPVNDEYNNSHKYGTARILDGLPKKTKIIMLPNLYFTGYAPDCHCVSYKKQFMLEPMPIHDTNLIYLYMKHDGDREGIYKEYQQILAADNYYSQKIIEEGIAASITELEKKENSAIEKYKSFAPQFIRYSEIVKSNFRKSLLCYSDSHPTEDAFVLCGDKILEVLGLSSTIQKQKLKELGVLPFYKSVEKILDFEITKTDIVINNHRCDLTAFVDRYCNAYDKYEKRDLKKFIDTDITKVIVTNHKTGTILFKSILEEYCQNSNDSYLDFTQYLFRNKESIDPDYDFNKHKVIFIAHVQHFARLIKTVPGFKYRAVHVIRHPYEILMSGVRYHQVTNEAWCNKKVFIKKDEGFEKIINFNVDNALCNADYSYKDIMLNEDMDGKIMFELKQHKTTFGTINSIYDFLVRHKKDHNIMTVKLEFLDDENTIKEMLAFLNFDESYFDLFNRRINNKELLAHHVTNKADDKYTYKVYFKPEHYKAVLETFGNDLLEVFDYG